MFERSNAHSTYFVESTTRTDRTRPSRRNLQLHLRAVRASLGPLLRFDSPHPWDVGVRVDKHGFIHWNGQRIFVSSALCHEHLEISRPDDLDDDRDGDLVSDLCCSVSCVMASSHSPRRDEREFL